MYFRIFIDAATLKVAEYHRALFAYRRDFRIFIDAATLKVNCQSLSMRPSPYFRIFIDAATLKEAGPRDQSRGGSRISASL